jgi:PAS domain S-box-containing protein
MGTDTSRMRAEAPLGLAWTGERYTPLRLSRRRLWLRVGVVLAGWALYLLMHSSDAVGIPHESIQVAALIPVLLTGLFLGTAMGGLMGLAVVPLSEAGWLAAYGESLSGLAEHVNPTGVLHLVVAGALVGRLQELGAQVSVQLRERTEARQAVRALSDRSARLLEALGEGVCGLDAQGRVTFINPMACALLGVVPEALLGRSFSVLGAADPVEQALGSGEPVSDVRLPLSRPDGGLVWVALSCMPLEAPSSEAGGCDGAVVTFRDLTAELAATRELRRSEEEHRTVIESITDALVIRVGRRRAFVNAAYLSLMGYASYEEALGGTVGDDVLEDDRTRFSSELASATGAQEARFTYRITRRSDGQVRTIDCTTVPMVYRGEVAQLGVLRDVTDYQQALEARTASEARWRSVVEGSPNLLLTLLADGEVTFINRGILGRVRDEFIGTSFFYLFPLGSRAVVRHSLERAVYHRESTACEAVGYARNGGEAWYTVRFSPVLGPDGQVRELTAMTLDVSQLKAVEEAASARSGELEGLLSIASAMDGVGDLQERMASALAEVERVTNADLLVIRDAQEVALPIASVRSKRLAVSDDEVRSVVLRRTRFSQKALATRAPAVVNDLAAMPNATGSFSRMGVNATAVLPLLVGDEAMGTLLVCSTQAGFFTEARLRVLQGVADILATHLHNHRLQVADIRRAWQMEAQFETARVLAEPGEFTAKASAVLGYLVHAVRADWLSLALPSKGSKGLAFVAQAGKIRVPTEGMSVPQDSVCARAWASGSVESMASGEAAQAACPPQLGWMNDAVAVPVRSGERVVAVLVAGSKDEGHFTTETIRFLSDVVGNLGGLFEHARIHQQLRDEAAENVGRLEAFRAVAGRLTLGEDPSHALEQLAQVSVAMVGGGAGGIAVWDDAGSAGPSLVLRHGEARLLDEVFAQARRRGEPLWLGPGAPEVSDPGLRSLGEETGGLVAVPFRSLGGQLGVLAVISGFPDVFGPADVRQLGLFGVLASIMLDNFRLYQAEAAERSALHAVQSSMAEGLVVGDPAGFVRYWNRSAEEMTGIPASVAMGMHMADLVDAYAQDRTDPEMVTRVKGLLTGDWAEPVTVVIERTGEAMTGSPRAVRDLETTYFPIPQSDGSQHLGVVLRDMTEERDLRRRSDAFVSMASHELRTPMTSVLGFTELLLKRDPDPQTRRKWLDAIYTDSLHMATLVDEMLDVAMIQAGRVSLDLRPVDAPEVVREVLAALRPVSERHHLVLEAPGTVWVQADRTKLVQVVTKPGGERHQVLPCWGRRARAGGAGGRRGVHQRCRPRRGHQA